MRVSYKWLKEYVDIPVSPKDLADKMTMSGVAVENLEYLGKNLDKIVTARIETIAPHPNADKLVVCQINIGAETLQVVTGAPNVREGQIVLLALVGATLPEMKITKAKLRGVESNGMLCSAQELGLDPDSFPPDQRQGILEFPAETPLGMDVKELLGLDDVILELELTPNRSDCLSMLGVAREVSAVLGTALKLPEVVVKETGETIDGKVSISIENPEFCGRYVGRLIRNVKIGPSPLWMQRRLQAAGVRPISNIVDVTNYVMIEFGQPLHSFDYDKLRDHAILVRKARDGEKIYSLDNIERELTSDMLVITDPGGPVAIAGVMGGLDTEITDETSSVLLESAYFKPASIHRTSKKLALRSESSMRFEKGIDINGSLLAANRACQLIQEMGAGEIVSGYVDNYPAPKENPVITLRPARIKLILGIEIPREQINKIMVQLGFGVKEDGENFVVEVPTRRDDIQVEIDLIEEVARLFGYNNIPTTLPEGASTQGRKTEMQASVDKVIDLMTECGLNEIITLSFMNPRVFDMLNLPPGNELRNAVTVENPLSEEQRVLRTTIIPGLLDILSRNTARKNKDMAFFEVGRIFTPVAGEKLPKETLTLGAVVNGNTTGNWQNQPQEMDFYYLKGIAESLLNALNVQEYSFVTQKENKAFHPGRTANITVKGEEAGIIGEIHPNVAENYKLGGRIFVMLLNIENVINASGGLKRVNPLPKYPSIERDIAIVISQEVPSAEITKVIVGNGGKLLKNVELFDVYEGEQIQKGYKSMAFSLKFQAPDRTLTDEEVSSVYEKIQRALKTTLHAELRA